MQAAVAPGHVSGLFDPPVPGLASSHVEPGSRGTFPSRSRLDLKAGRCEALTSWVWLGFNTEGFVVLVALLAPFSRPGFVCAAYSGRFTSVCVALSSN